MVRTIRTAKVRSDALRLIHFRARSQQELERRLKTKGYTSQEIEEVIRSFKKAGYLDDALFAKLWLESRLKKPFGLRRIRFELKQKGIAPGLIQQTLNNAKVSYSEEAAIRTIIESKLRYREGVDPVKMKSRLYTLLLRRGFAHQMVLDVLKDIFKLKEEPQEL